MSSLVLSATFGLALTEARQGQKVTEELMVSGIQVVGTGPRLPDVVYRYRLVA